VQTEISAPLADAWDFYFDDRRWPTWVDGFASVTAALGYPDVGGTLQWRSTPAGRGVVSERVLEHEARRRHRIEFSDAYASGEQTTGFEIARASGEAARTRVTLELLYRLADGGLLGPITDPIFVRPQMRRSLTRTLERLRGELSEEQPSASGVPLA